MSRTARAGAVRIGIDIGGTFTDIVVMSANGQFQTKKISSSVENYALAVAEGLNETLAEYAIPPDAIAELRHGTTVASNAILEQKGARTGLIGTRGFRDILQIRDLRLPRLYDLAWDKPPTLVERYLRRTVDERINTRGHITRPLDLAEVKREVAILLGEGVEAIAICLLNAFANPVHERQIRDIVAECAPGLPCCISSDVLPEIGEYERTATTVVNTYVLPVVARYLATLQADLAVAGIAAPLRLMQSNGGLTTAEDAARLPMNIVESGPAAGVVGARAVAVRLGLHDIISFDMGGTTAKASLIEGGTFSRSPEYQVGGGVIMGSRLLTGAGYLLKVPAIDLAEVGAGGGSIVWIDAGGSLQIGPHSAAADPGPVCYDIGGTQPTVTDAVLTLGYINPAYLVNGRLRLNAEKARTVFEQQIARPLGLSLERAAHGAFDIAVARMMRAIKAVSTERGRDPRRFGLFAFGGNGPVFGAAMARALGVRRVVIPPAPGLFSAFGLLYADVEHHRSRSFRRPLREAGLVLEGAWEGMAEDASAMLAAEGFAAEHRRIERLAALRYQGQAFELTIPVPAGPLDEAAVAVLGEAFGQEHERTYGHRAGPDEPIEIITLRIIARGLPDAPAVPERITVADPDNVDRPAPRQAYFGPRSDWCETPVILRQDLDAARRGPCIIEEYGSTCVVPPGFTASMDDFGNVVLDQDDTAA